MFLQGTDPFALFAEMQQRQAIDPAHAFYLGYEMAKAVTALTLGKNYVQDQALRWGFLTVPEESHHGTMKEQPRQPGSKIEESSMAERRLAASTLPGQAPPDAASAAGRRTDAAPDPWEVFRRLAGLPHLLVPRQRLTDSRCSAAIRLSPPTRSPGSGRAAGRSWLTDRHAGAGERPTRLPVLAERLAAWRADSLPGLPPFQGGAAGLFGYDLCHHLERLPRPRFDEFEMPDLAVGFYDWVRRLRPRRRTGPG